MRGALYGNSTTSLVQQQATPLHVAAQDGHSEVVSALLAAGADIEAKTMVS